MMKSIGTLCTTKWNLTKKIFDRMVNFWKINIIYFRILKTAHFKPFCWRVEGTVWWFTLSCCWKCMVPRWHRIHATISMSHILKNQFQTQHQTILSWIFPFFRYSLYLVKNFLLYMRIFEWFWNNGECKE